MIGEQIGAYRVISQLGAGGMGVVYIGEHVELGNQVAIKLLLPELSRNQESIQRFFNEAKAATKIRNAGIVQVYDFGRHNGSAYFVMELLEGQSLAARLEARGRLPSGQVAQLGRQIANTLAAAHAQGIVHRDLKPDNIMLVPDSEVPGGERARILDFGIAKLADTMTTPMSLKTRTGSLMGTPYYMSPEQSRGAGEVDLRSDIYSVGCILFEMVAGRPPFDGEGLGEVLGKHQFVAAPSLSELVPDVAPELAQTIMRALAKAPEERHQTMGELAAELDVTVRTSAGQAAVSPPQSSRGAAAVPLSSQAAVAVPQSSQAAAVAPLATQLPVSAASGPGKGCWIVVALLGCVAAAAVAFFVLRNRGSGAKPVVTRAPDATPGPDKPAVPPVKPAPEPPTAATPPAPVISPPESAQPTPIKPAPIKPVPVKPAPVKPAPVKPVPVKPAPVPTPPVPTPPVPTPPAPTPADSLDEAKAAFAANQWDHGLQLVKAALRQDPGNQHGLSLAVMAACKLHRPRVAQNFASRMAAGPLLETARGACQRAGLTLP